MEKTKVDEIFDKGQPFVTTKASPGETAQSILASFDRPGELIILQLSETLYMIYLKSKEEEVKRLVDEAIEQVKKEELDSIRELRKRFPNLIFDRSN